MHCPQAIFVTGTDTEVGKTLASCALLHVARRQGLSALGMKPVAAGLDAEGRQEDVEQLLAASSFRLPRELVNPYAFATPIAPHLAALDEGQPIIQAMIRAAFERLAGLADLVVVEGVGGFRVPLGERFDTADMAQALGLPVVLVVGLRLGCLNHALLTAEAILRRKLPFVGWIANTIDPAMARRDDNIAALRQRLPAPLLGVLPFDPAADADAMSRHLELPSNC